MIFALQTGQIQTDPHVVSPANPEVSPDLRTATESSCRTRPHLHRRGILVYGQSIERRAYRRSRDERFPLSEGGEKLFALFSRGRSRGPASTLTERRRAGGPTAPRNARIDARDGGARTGLKSTLQVHQSAFERPLAHRTPIFRARGLRFCLRALSIPEPPILEAP